MVVISRMMRTLIVLAVLVALAQPAHAAILRPNALDRQVDAIADARLLQAPAVALVDPDRQEAAARLMRWEEPGWLAMIVFEILVLAYFWQSGTAARLRDRLRLHVRSMFLVRFLFGCCLGALAKCTALPFEFYLYRVNRIMGLSGQLSLGWIADWFFALLIDVAFAGCVTAIVLWLSDRTRRWYMYTIFAILAGSVIITYANPFVIAPLSNRYVPLHAPLAGDLQQLERKAGYENVPIEMYDRSKRTQTIGANVIGFGATRIITLSDTLVAASTPGEVEFYTARAIGHVKLGDPMRLAIIEALIVILGTAFAVIVADRIGFRRDDDPLARIALVGALLGVMYLVAVPIDNACSRAIEGQADSYAIALTHDPAPAIRAMIRRADEQIESPCPGVLARLYFLRGPAIGERVQTYNSIPSRCP